MATAIDFKAMLAAERKKMREQLLNNLSADDGSEPNATSSVSNSSEEDLCMGWLDYPDPNIYLSPKPLIKLEDNVVRGAVKGIMYIPDFVTETEAAALLARIDDMPESSWAKLRRRRLQNHGGTPHPDGMIPKSVPKFITSVMKSIVQAGIFKEEQSPNHVLLNEYKCGQGIAPHQDGPLYEPKVAILSLAGPSLLQFWPSLAATKSGEPAASVLCLPNSLLVFREDAYIAHWHGIDQVEADTISEHTGNISMINKAAGKENQLNVGDSVPRGPKRISLTIRRVLHIKDPESEILTPAAQDERRRKQEWWLKSRGEDGVLS